jgi:hypothetical protein
VNRYSKEPDLLEQFQDVVSSVVGKEVERAMGIMIAV